MKHLAFGSQVQIQAHLTGLFIYPCAKQAWESQPLDFWVWISVSLHEALKKPFFRGKTPLGSKAWSKSKSQSLQMTSLSLSLGIPLQVRSKPPAERQHGGMGIPPGHCCPSGLQALRSWCLPQTLVFEVGTAGNISEKRWLPPWLQE